MAKVNWGTTATVLESFANPAAKKLRQWKDNRSQKSSDGSSTGPGPYYQNASSDVEPTDFHRGGKVRKTGLAKVHKGERVLTKQQAKRYMGRKRG